MIFKTTHCVFQVGIIILNYFIANIVLEKGKRKEVEGNEQRNNDEETNEQSNEQRIRL